MCARLTAHAGDAMTKYMVGKDGKTPRARLFGNTCREEALEFGEQLWWCLAGTADHNVCDGAAVEKRRMAGVPLGLHHSLGA